jgi:hypothetical protein
MAFIDELQHLRQTAGSNRPPIKPMPQGDTDPVANMIQYFAQNMKGAPHDQPYDFGHQVPPEYYSTPSIYPPPQTGVTFGEIMANAPKSVVQTIRKMMASEARNRGPKAANIVDELARGMWFHGRGTYPKTGETFGKSRFKTGNLGEPAGMSLTADKGLLERHFAKTQDQGLSEIEMAEYAIQWKIWKDPTLGKEGKRLAKKEMQDILKNNNISGPYNVPYQHTTTPHPEVIKEMGITRPGDLPAPFARVHPKFGGPPAEKILPAWKAPETEWAQEVLRDAYVEAAGRVLGEIPRPVIEPQIHGGSVHKTLEAAKRVAAEENIKDPVFRHVKKGVDQYEEGGTVLQDGYYLYGDPTAKHLQQVLEESGELKGELNAEISKILQKKGYKALLYSPGRYNEYEMRMLNPDDVTMLDMRTQGDKGLGRLTKGTGLSAINDMPPEWHTAKTVPERTAIERRAIGSQTRRMGDLDTTTSGAPSSLRDIYKDISFEDLVKLARQEVANK